MRSFTQISLLLILSSCSLPVFGCAASNTPTEQSMSLKEPLLAKLETAEKSDEMNSLSWTADNPTVDRLYGDKAAALGDVITRIKAGQKVDPSEIDRDLNNQEIEEFGGY